ncbi:hypothetical protein QBC34DRAFT_298735 [Podospora aff. communis PSN243]|uniref:Uncharacterized protein n=1 Tax=Podospora aff. communis PSN243 TaxID=3040156 RepID=A0AAV9GNS3_9PEZI|nr:hypothetical protein QBC34DRAFT_298735 [Podospora aff. communis PSN243]
MKSTSSPMTYIPPLCDGACGTLPRSQQHFGGLLRAELMDCVRMMPAMCWSVMRQMRGMGVGDMRDMVLHVLLGCMEVGMMVAALPVMMMMPGVVAMMWMACCAVVVMGMCTVVNGREMVCVCSEGGEGVEDEKWMFVGGMGMSSRRCHRVTLPMMSRLFNRPITCIYAPTYGLPFDTVIMMLQRCLHLPSQTRRNLYAQMRSSLLDDAMHRVVVLCHNHSAITVSHAVSQLCADLPHDKLRKLEIYTFGSAAPEFMMPLGEANLEPEPTSHSPLSSQHPADIMSASTPPASPDRKSIHIEHFAMSHDPFAQLGVLRSVRRDMDGRMCGGVFIMNACPPSTSATPSQRTTAMSTSTPTTMESYLHSLFPSHLPSNPNTRSLLDYTMHIDRDCAEKREITAMTNYHSASHSRSSKTAKRLSWTGLAAASVNGAAAQKGMNGVSAGMMGLEMARRGCKDCSGHKGREVSWLVRYVGGMQMGMGAGGNVMGIAGMEGGKMEGRRGEGQ